MNGFWSTDPATWNGAARPIAHARPRSHVVVAGAIRAAAEVTVGSSPAWRCTLADSTGEIELIFLGRHRMAGLEPGRYCGVTGTAVSAGPAGRQRLVIWNPLYQLSA